VNYPCQSCIIDQLTIKGSMESDDLKHMCRLNVDGYDSYAYMTAVHDLLNEGHIVRVGDDGFRIAK
jgi:hypothetical protein